MVILLVLVKNVMKELTKTIKVCNDKIVVMEATTITERK